MDWYSIKLLYKMRITGEPDRERLDEHYSGETEFFEESIVLVAADSFDNAYKIAENHARENDEVYINKYGQTVNREFYDSVDCFHMIEPPQLLTEVYSTFFIQDKNADEKGVIDQRYKNCTAEELYMLRYQ